MSNLFAALGWYVVDLVEHPEAGAAMRHGDLELVTTFGHGRHACPARSFSLSAMTLTAERLLGRYTLDAGWDERPRPVPAQIGGVARAAAPCPVRYARRHGTDGRLPE